MRLSKMLGYRKAKLRNRIITLGVIIAGMLSLTVGIVTFYGQNAGNFVISIDSAALRRGITLSEDPNFLTTSTRLMTEPINEARDMTYTWLKLDEVQATYGNFTDVDYDYVAYTFFIKNNGRETVDITYHIRITDVFNDLDAAIRILVIEDDVQTMYQKEDQPDEHGNLPYYPDTMPTTQNFLSETIVMRKMFVNFQPQQIRKFSVLVWIEGYDPDTSDEILGGMIRLQMNFSINNLGV